MTKRITILTFISILLANVTFAQSTDVFKKENIKSMMLKTAKWQLNNPLHETYDWTNGAFYAGVFAAYETTKSDELLNAMTQSFDKINWQTGKRFDHADDIAISQTYIDLYRLKKDKKFIQPTIDAIKRIGVDKSNEVEKHGIIWWWCDALFMAPPTFAKLAKDLKDKSYLEKNDKFFQETYDLLYDKQEQLFARDASYLPETKREANGKKVFWSRGNGWVLGGLVRLLKELPKDYPKRTFYLNLYKEMAAKILTLQQSDGLWRSSLLDPDSFPGGEASGSGFYLYALAWGINNGHLDKNKYLPAVKKGWISLNNLVTPEGKVGWCQPIGADPRRNFTAESWEVYGAGAFLLAGSEVIKLK
ncbi:MAG TPA: glycoside hydrolase family 88 protein [Pyrinomonadaceae bacterium]|nr:glycoside hydrolase family 88 protein [Pyrinomonadaceae bacterium]